MIQPNAFLVRGRAFTLLGTVAFLSLLSQGTPGFAQNTSAPPHSSNAAAGVGGATLRGQGAATSVTEGVVNLKTTDFPAQKQNKRDQSKASDSPLKGHGTATNQGVMGAENRGVCTTNKENFVPLAPGIVSRKFDSNDPKKSPVQYTPLSTPTLYFFSSYKHPVKGMFRLYNPESGQLLYNFSVKIPLGKQVFAVELPPSIQLVPGKRYIWQLSIYTKGKQTAFKGFKGIIEQRPLSTEQQAKLTAASDLEKVHLYAQYGYWDKAIEALSSLDSQEKRQSIVTLAERLNITKCFKPSS